MIVNGSYKLNDIVSLVKQDHEIAAFIGGTYGILYDNKVKTLNLYFRPSSKGTYNLITQDFTALDAQQILYEKYPDDNIVQSYLYIIDRTKRVIKKIFENATSVEEKFELHGGEMMNFSLEIVDNDTASIYLLKTLNCENKIALMAEIHRKREQLSMLITKLKEEMAKE